MSDQTNGSRDLDAVAAHLVALSAEIPALNDEYNALAKQKAAERARAIQVLIDGGWSLTRVGALLGVKKQRVHALLKAAQADPVTTGG
jgi:hypothetical protein